LTAWRGKFRVRSSDFSRTKAQWSRFTVREPRPQESRGSLQFAVLCETALGDGLRVRFRADGRSMQPNVLDGDTVVVAPISAGRPGRGDIALTRGEQGFVLHRVVGWDPATGAIVTRGDAGQQNDAPAEKLLGKVIAIERGGRTISTLAPGTTLLHRFRTQMHRSVRAGARRADRFRTALAPVAFMLFAVLLHASPAAAQATLTITDGAAPNPVASGANITYTQVVANTSGNAATGAKLTQNTPANTVFESVTPPTGWTCGTTPAVGGTGAITCTDATVPANSSGTFTVVVEASPEATGGSTITDTVTVGWTGPRGGGSNVGSASGTVRGADISMTQTVAPATVAPGGTITYTESVTNNGPNTASGVTLYQQTPTNTTFASITAAAGWTCTSPAVGATGQGTCTIASLNSGTSSGNFTYVVTVGASVAAGTTIVNTADANSGTSDPVSSNNATTTSVLVEAAADADMAVSMQASPSPVYVSSPITYTIQVSNLGLSSASAVSVVDTLPSTLAGASATTSSGSCGAPTGGTITCSLGTVASGAGPITISVTGTSPGTAGTLTNSAKVSSTTTDPVSSNNTATVVTVVQPLVCGTPGKDGAGGTLTGVVNTYYAGTGTPAAGATSITVTTPSSGSATQIGVNDLLLVIQMQGAQINSTNTSSYGDGVAGDPASGSTSLGNSGQFEFVTVTAVAAGTGTETLTIQGSGAGAGLLNSYASVAASNTSSPPQGIQTFQVIRVPQYSSATLSSTLAALAWNGSVGGVLALDVSAQLTLNGTVVLDGQGFRGGGGATDANPTSNNQNSGGGGGANGGTGGIGGFGWDSAGIVGGFGGVAFPA